MTKISHIDNRFIKFGLVKKVILNIKRSYVTFNDLRGQTSFYEKIFKKICIFFV